jgi:hypothetical protein
MSGGGANMGLCDLDVLVDELRTRDKKPETGAKTVLEKLEEELNENGEQKAHVITDSDLFAGEEL